jgi:hypothetical protein
MMNRAKMMSEQAINKIDAGSSDFEYVGMGSTVVIGKDADGTWWVADNGDAVEGLTRAEALRLAEEAANS